MSSPAIVGLLATLAAADPSGVSEADVPALVEASLQLRGWLDAFDASLATRPAADLTGGGRRSARDVEQVRARAAVCSAMPDVHAALAAGDLSAGHVDAIARVADRLEPAERDDLAALAPQLVDAAGRQSVETFGRETRRLVQLLSADGGLGHHERLRQQRSLRRWVDRQGLCHTQITLDPEADAKLSNALDAAVASERVKHETRTFEQVKADAFMTLVTGPRATGRRPAEVTVLVDEATLRQGLHARSVCETSDGLPLPVDAVRRLCCDADIIPVVLNGQGVAVDQGRKQRSRRRPSAGSSGRCTGTAASPVARSGSPTARSTTSSNGSNSEVRPTSTTCCRSAADITTPCMTAAGPCACTPTAPSSCADPTAPSTRTTPP
jgi:hypothetical protein